MVVCMIVATKAEDPLATLHLNPNTITVSGISAGGAASVQYEYSFSSQVHANGIVAGLPYLCAQGSTMGALTCMSSPYGVDLTTLVFETMVAAQEGKIDSLENLKNHTVFIFSGTADTVVAPGTVMLMKQMYTNLNVTKHVSSFFEYPAEHAWVTNSYGNPCNWRGDPYVNNCDFDFAGAFLQKAFKNMNVPWNATRGKYVAASMQEFDQSAYGASSYFNSMDETGYVYVPQRCRSSKARCHLHINFHGCEQYRTKLGTIYVSQTGLNEWAESNGIVVLYPQATMSLISNPKGCFDWWGYASQDYAFKAGAQNKIINAISTKLTS